MDRPISDGAEGPQHEVEAEVEQVGVRTGRGSLALSVLLVHAILLAVGNAGSTLARLQDHAARGSSFHASTSSTPPGAPGSVHLGTLHVGDACESAPLFTVYNDSGWPASLTVSAEGWLDDSSVVITPASLPPGGTAQVLFTRTAVGPPQPITGQVVVTADPGGLQTVVALSGEVANPAKASDPPPATWPGCQTTPRTAEAEAPAAEPEGEAPAAEPEAEAPPQDHISEQGG